MKHFRKATLLILALMMTLALGIFAAACGDDTGSGSVVLTFDAGSGEPYTLDAEAGSAVTPPVPDARDGYLFDGWFGSSDFSGVALGSSLTAPETDTTYYGKWSKAYLLTLALDGGTMSGEKTILLREGASLSDAVAAYMPEKDGLTFGAWMLDEKELTADDRMPAGALTLTAGWKVGYTVQVYLQNKAGDGYELSSELGTEGNGYVGVKTTPAVPYVTGFYLANHENGLTEAVLTETASSNVFRLYFAREEYYLAFDANLPEGIEAEGEISEQTALFEQEVTIPDEGLSAAGRLFAGWSTQRTGAVEYQPGASLPLTHDLVLYAVWDVGCTDLWGSEDLVYSFVNEPGKAVLERFGEFFEGTIDENGVFEIAGMSGMIYHGSVFAYYREDYAATFYLLDGYYHAEETDLIDKNATLTLDGYLNATIRAADGSVTVGSYGYNVKEESNYIAAEDGTILYFRLGNYRNTAVFGIRGDEAGLYEQFVPTDEKSGTRGRWIVYLDGYGSVLLGDSSSGTYSEGVYYFEDSGYSAGGEEIRFYHVFTTETDELVFHNYPLTSGEALVLDDGLSGDYKGEIDGKETTVTLDGFGLLNGATFNGDPNSACMYYTTESSVFGTILFLLTDDKPITLLLTGEDEYEEFDINYTELLYLRTDGSRANLFYPAILLYEDKDEIRAELYAPDDDGETQHVATAVCTVRNDFPEYRFLTLTLRQTYGGATVIFPGFDAAFESAAILLDTESLIYDIYSVLEYNGEKFYNEYKYRTDDKEDDRIFWENLIDSGVNGIGSFLFGDGNVVEGRAVKTYTNIQEFGFTAVAFNYYNADDLLETRYFALYDGGTFLDLDEEPDHAMLMDEYGTLKQQAGVYFDGAGNAYYFASGNDFYDHISIGGPVRKTEEKTSFGAEIWIIEPKDGQPLRFILEQETENTLVAYVYYEEPVSLTGENGSFAADGYNFMASFVSADGISFTGLYHMLNAEDCSIPDEYAYAYVMMVQDGLFWRIYVRENGTFDALCSPLGNMDGSFLMVMDDSYNALGMLMVSLEDGAMSVMYIGMDEETIGLPMSEGNPFLPTDDGAVSLTLMLMNETTESMDIVTWVLGDFSVDSCVIFNEAICGAYHDGAASYEMDGYGYGVYTDRYGFRNEGAYVFIDDTHVAFEFAQSAGNAVLKIDADEKTFTELDLAPYYATYYCGDSTIEFADYVYIDGTPVGFWYAEDGVVVFAIYSDDDGTYHTVTFQAGDSFVYEGKTYTPAPSATGPDAEAVLADKFEA